MNRLRQFIDGSYARTDSPGRSAGKQTVKREPIPGWLSTAMLPLYFSHNGLCNRQSQAVATVLMTARLVCAPKALEYMRQLCRRNPDAGVLNNNNNTTNFPFPLDRDRPLLD